MRRNSNWRAAEPQTRRARFESRARSQLFRNTANDMMRVTQLKVKEDY